MPARDRARGQTPRFCGEGYSGNGKTSGKYFVVHSLVYRRRCLLPQQPLRKHQERSRQKYHRQSQKQQASHFSFY